MNWEFNHARPQNGKEVIALRKAVRNRLFKPVKRKDPEAAVILPFEQKRAVEPPTPQAWLTEEPFEHVKDYYAAVGEGRGARQYLYRRCAEIGISMEEVLSQSRQHNTVFIRQLLCYELRENFALSWMNVARILGQADHTTSMWAYNKIARMKQDGTFEAVYGDGNRRYYLSDKHLAVLAKIGTAPSVSTREIKSPGYKNSLPKLHCMGFIHLAEGSPRFMWALTDAGRRALKERGL